MHGLMMNQQLLVPSLLEFAARYHSDAEIVTRTVEGPVQVSTYESVYKRTQQLAHALVRLGVKPGDRVATLAWNTSRHFELYYAISGIGAVCHTVNPRLGGEQMSYIINHAEDVALFYDTTFSGMVENLKPKLNSVKDFCAMTDASHADASAPGSLIYEELIASESEAFDWPDMDESAAAALCYTSGTTGNPKGVLYSHRATVLHAMASCFSSTLNLRTSDTVLPVVPMFHVNAWGIPYSVPIVGARLVMPGPKLDGVSLFELMDAHGVTAALGVPTVWTGLLDEMDRKQRPPNGLEYVLVGGAAVSPSMIDRFELDHGVRVHHAWGMTEMSPLGTVNTLKPKFADLPRQEQMPIKLKQGRVVYGVDMRTVGETDEELPRDGKSSGRLQVRGPWIVERYFKESESALTSDGWFDTGDVATLDADGYMQITDRAKDVIKSGGEWISSVDLENVASGHPGIEIAAVIGVPHSKWQERPLLVCVPANDDRPLLSDIHTYLADKVPKWWMPDAVEWVDSLPIGATGKIQKTELRKRFADYRLQDD